MTTFTGFGDAAVDFYEGLEADNSKAYWSDNRAIYDEQVRGPMLALLVDLEREFGVGKVFRPHRDVRFSADKTPYKTQCGATAGPYYVQLSADGVTVAAGYYAMVPAQVARYPGGDRRRPVRPGARDGRRRAAGRERRDRRRPAEDPAARGRP